MSDQDFRERVLNVPCRPQEFTTERVEDRIERVENRIQQVDEK